MTIQNVTQEEFFQLILLEEIIIGKGQMERLKMKLRDFVEVQGLVVQEQQSSVELATRSAWPDGMWKGVKLTELSIPFQDGVANFRYSDGSHKLYKLW